MTDEDMTFRVREAGDHLAEGLRRIGDRPGPGTGMERRLDRLEDDGNRGHSAERRRNGWRPARKIAQIGDDHRVALQKFLVVPENRLHAGTARFLFAFDDELDVRHLVAVKSERLRHGGEGEYDARLVIRGSAPVKASVADFRG